MVKEETLKAETREEAKYRPRVLITMRIRPNVKMEIGRRRILTIGLRKISKKAKIRPTLVIIRRRF